MPDLLKKYKELLLYIVFGAVTTLVNLVVYHLCNLVLGERWYLVSNVIAWVVAVLTAYLTNKLWVFESKSWAFAVLRREVPTFVGARVFSLLMEEVGLYLMIDCLSFDSWSLTLPFLVIGGAMIAKLLMQVVVVILNYIFSKLVIFKKNNA